MKEFKQFRKDIQKVGSHRVHKIKNSYGVYDAYKWVRKNKWLDIGKPVQQHEFYKIIRTVSDYISDSLIKTGNITLPLRMGVVEVRKYKPVLEIRDGQVVSRQPIDWDKTLKLWYEDQEALENKQLVRQENKFVFKIVYDKSQAKYKNKGYYSFKLNRSVKRIISNKIKLGDFDAFLI